MRVSLQEHTLAVLRVLLGKYQQEMADLAGCSRATIQAVELGNLNLSQTLAMRISSATGIDLGWLLRDDVQVPALGLDGKPYTLEGFHARRAAKMALLSQESIERTPDYLLGCYTELRAILASAGMEGEQQWQLAWYKLDQAIGALRKEFGALESIDTGGACPSFAPYQLTLVEHDVFGARRHFENDGFKIDRQPTDASMIPYREFRRQYEFPKPPREYEDYQFPDEDLPDDSVHWNSPLLNTPPRTRLLESKIAAIGGMAHDPPTPPDDPPAMRQPKQKRPRKRKK